MCTYFYIASNEQHRFNTKVPTIDEYVVSAHV